METTNTPSSLKTKQWETDLNGIPNLRFEERFLNPSAPADDEILVKIHAVSLNYKDGETINGLFKHHKTSKAPPNLVPCSDSAGEVVAIGGAVTKWKVGDRVLSTSYPSFLTGQIQARHMAEGVGAAVNGCLTQYRMFKEFAVVATPKHLSDIEACNLQIAGTTAWMAMNGMRPLGKPGGEVETVLIQGTGGVAIMGLLIAKASGAKVIITSSSDSKLQRAQSLGADILINYKSHPNWDEVVLAATDNLGADIIFENGGAQTTAKSFRCIKWGSLINSIGYVSGKVDPEGDRQNINVSALMRNFTLKGLLNGPRDRFEELLAFVEEKNIRPVVDRVFEFHDAREALEYLWSGSHFGKVVVKMD